ncbi:MAG: glycosyltransferase family 4 protein [Myxococcota bacterium]
MQKSERELRVLHVITRLIVGGAQENTLLTAIGQHNTKGMKVALLTGYDFGPEGTIEDQARAAGIDMHHMREMVRPIAPATDAVALAKLTSFIRRGNFDVVHTHASKAGIIGRLAARAAGTPIIVHTLHGLIFGDHAKPWENALYINLERLCAGIAHKVIDVSDATRRAAIAHGVGSADKHITIYSGFRIEPYLQIRERLSVADAKRRFGLEPSDLVIGKVARLFEKKGHEYVIAAARQIVARVPQARFLFVGDGVLRSKYEADVAQAGLRDHFVFAGLIAPEEMPAAMQAMDVLVHTSHREGLARVIPQAQAVGKPVVSFALDGSLDAIQDGVSGFLTRPHDANHIAERVLEIINDEARRQAMGEAGRAFAAANFPVEVMVRRINDVYWQLASERLSHRAA